jgi:hypothetical protein
MADDRSFIAKELRDLLHNRTYFEPFEILLLDGSVLPVGHPRLVVMLSGGVSFEQQDGSSCIFPYDNILCLRTIFDV